jgi:hypothetical protein
MGFIITRPIIFILMNNQVSSLAVSQKNNTSPDTYYLFFETKVKVFPFSLNK